MGTTQSNAITVNNQKDFIKALKNRKHFALFGCPRDEFVMVEAKAFQKTSLKR